MATCPTCGLPLTRGSDGLLKCGVCGFTYKPNQKTPLLSAYAPKSAPIQIPDADQDLQVFVDRVIQKIVPIHTDYSTAIKKSLAETRQKIRRDLLDVFSGKQNFDKWFTKTRRLLGLHQLDLTQILYDSLEGLQSREAREMRLQYEQTLRSMQQSYRPTM